MPAWRAGLTVFFGQSCRSLPGFCSGSGSVSLGLFGIQAKWVMSLNEKREFSSEISQVLRLSPSQK